MRNLLLLFCASAMFALGGVAMKYSAGLTRPGPSAGVFALFAAGAAMQAVAMRDAEMGPVYITVLGLEAVLAFGLGIWLFGESASAMRVVAVALVLAGIVLLRY